MTNPDVEYQGGQVIGNVQLVPIIWGNGWPYNAGSPLPGQLLAFLQFFVGPNNPIMAMLQHDYSTAGTQIVPGSVANNKMIIAPGSPPAALTDAQIQSTLQSWIINQNGFPQPNLNTVYMIFLPQSVTVTLDILVSCSNMVGYHSSNGNVYVVIPCCTPPTQPLGLVFEVMTTVCSHELSEVITNPRDSGWSDANTFEEIGDICQDLNAAPGNVSAGAGQTFAVQPIWSRSQNNCVFGPPVKLSEIILPSAVYGGQPVSGSVSLSGLAPTLPPAGVSVSLSTNNAVVHFNPSSVAIAPAQGSAPISATTTGVKNTVVVTATAALGAQTIARSLTVLPSAIDTFKYTPGSAQGYQKPPSAPEGTLTLKGVAPAGGLIVNIVSSEPSLALPVPDELSIAAGASSPSEKFYLGVQPVGVNTPVTLMASISGSSHAFTFQVLAGAPSNIIVKHLMINPPTVIGGMATFAHFTLAAPVGPGGGSITVSSSDPTVATVPATVHLPAGATDGSFTIQTKPLPQPIHTKHCTITAGQDGPLAFALLTTTSN